MNFSLYVFGTPNGYDQYPLDSNSAKFQEILTSCNSESQLSVLRDNQLIQYVYVRKISGDDGFCWGFGFVLVVTGVYCINCQTLNDLFETAFYDVLLKGKLLRYHGNSFVYQVSKFADDINELKRINSFFKSKLDYELGDLFVTIPSSFSVGNGQTSISMKESASDINFAVKNFDVVHITNGENNDSGRKPAKQPSSKPKRWVFWAMLAVVLMVGTAIATYIIVSGNPPINKIEEDVNCSKETYDDAIMEYNLKIDSIPVDGKGEYGKEDWVMDVFFALQKIEQYEKDSLSQELNVSPVFEDKLQLYRERLEEARTNIQDDIKPFQGMSDDYTNRMRIRLKTIDDMLEQTKGTSVLDVHPPKPET